MSRISIATPQEVVPIDRKKTRELAASLLAAEGVTDFEISIAFVDNAHIHRLNKQFLHHDEPTDVLTFPYSEEASKKLAGELVIGAEVGLHQATERGHDVQAELSLYVIHGLLHLCGYDDKSTASEREMREKERHYLKEFGLPDIAGE